MKKKLIMIGAGGHAKVCIEIAQLMDCWSEILILDDNEKNAFFEINGPVNDFYKYLENSVFFVAIGSNHLRKEIISEIENKNGSLAVLIHPSAIISSSVSIGNGTVIMPGSIVNANTNLGKGVILNSNSVVEHDNEINNYVHISPGTILSGNVNVGDSSWIGSNSTVVNNIKIIKETVIGAGSVVLKDIKIKGTYVGTPCKLIN